ncbi:MAG: hypothetical protein IJD93_07635 [Ruminococcus sp.]|nr:hypothetical protein [Ruminococcus sp.]
MLTILTIEDKLREGAGERLYSVLAPNSLNAHSIGEKLQIRHIKYINRNGRINWKKISSKAGKGKAQLLYSGSHPVPEESDIRLFEPLALRQRLCSNMALSVLEMLKEKSNTFRTGLYDPEGEFSDLPEHLLKFTDNLIVVTKNYKVYRQQAQRLLDERGAVLCVSPQTQLLSTCGLIVSPCVLDTGFTPMAKAVVLTCHKPRVPLACRVYYKYSFRLEPELEKLKPEALCAEIFAGALYSLCGFYPLGSVIPFVCTSDTDTQTTLSLRRYLCDCVTT